MATPKQIDYLERLGIDRVTASHFTVGQASEKISELKKEKEMRYRCSYCNALGHNRRTCPELARVRAGLPPTPSPAATAEELAAAASSTDIPFEGTPAAAIPSEPRKPQLPRKPKAWKLAEDVLPHARLSLLYGPPGTGKTTAANLFGISPGDEVFNVTMTEETPAAELRGHYVPKGGEFVWQDGPAMMAFRNGNRLVINEIDKSSGDALQFLHALCDDPGISRITLPTGDTVHPHENFRVVATMNGVPEDLPDAVRDRFAVSILIDKLHPDAIRTLPEDLWEAAANGISWDPSRSTSLRAWKAFANLREIVGADAAATAVFGNRAETILTTIKIGAKHGA